MLSYEEFLKNKMAISHQSGFTIDDSDLNSSLYPHVKDTVKWAIAGGRRAIFSSFGMQKTVTQLEILRIIIKKEGGKGLIVCPKREALEIVEKEMDKTMIDYVIHTISETPIMDLFPYKSENDE